MARIFITGSTDGLGRAAARTLIDEGHQVVLHARSRERASALDDSRRARLVNEWQQRCYPCTSRQRKRIIGTSRRNTWCCGSGIHRCVTSRGRTCRPTWRISRRQGYAPKTVDHIHDVLSAVLRTAVKWGHMQENPTRGVDLPALKTVLPKWVLTAPQAALLLAELPPLARTMAGPAKHSRGSRAPSTGSARPCHRALASAQP